MSKVLLGVLGVAVLGVSASARVPRHTRPGAKINVTLSDRVKPLVPASTQPAKPAITADDVLSIEGLTASIRAEHEQILEQLIANTPDREVEEKSDYYFRLGEAYAKQHRAWKLKGTQEAARKATDYLLKTVKTFKSLTENDAFRNYPKMDVALFYFGYTLQSGKYLKEARAVYDKLLKNYPNSKYVPEAHLAFADYYDESGQLADAEARYKMVLKFPKSPVYWYAQYKLGWIGMRLQRFQEALELFFQVVQATKHDTKHERVNRAAKLDFVRAYAEIGKADKAHAAFQRVDAATALELVHHLASIYVEQGKYDRSVFVHRELIAQAPHDARVCAWQYLAARAMLSAAGASSVDKVAEIEALAKLHATAKLPAPEADECRANAKAMTTELGRAWHSEASKTLNSDTYAFAVRLYDSFLAGFATDPARGEIQYLRAEALFAHATSERDDRAQLALWERAADAFTDVAQHDPQRAADAAHASVLARLNLLVGEPAPRPADAEVARRTRATPIAIPAREQKLVDAIATYAAHVPAQDPELGTLRFAQANLYRRFDHHDTAAGIYAGLLATHRAATFAESAAMLAIDSLIIVQRLEEMLRLADSLAADAAYLADKPELEKLVRYVRSRSMRR